MNKLSLNVFNSQSLTDYEVTSMDMDFEKKIITIKTDGATLIDNSNVSYAGEVSLIISNWHDLKVYLEDNNINISDAKNMQKVLALSSICEFIFDKPNLILRGYTKNAEEGGWLELIFIKPTIMIQNKLEKE